MPETLRERIRRIVWVHKDLDGPARADANVLVDMLVQELSYLTPDHDADAGGSVSTLPGIVPVQAGPTTTTTAAIAASIAAGSGRAS
jgi:hypothetical protein